MRWAKKKKKTISRKKVSIKTLYDVSPYILTSYEYKLSNFIENATKYMYVHTVRIVNANFNFREIILQENYIKEKVNVFFQNLFI